MPTRFIDRPETLQVLFHPRPADPRLATLAGGTPVAVPVAEGTLVGGMIFAAGPQAPAILFFHGNGEVAAEYGWIAPPYTDMGVTLAVMDYRGYGASDGWPDGSSLLADARAIVDALPDLLAQQGLQPTRLFVMGRSLGSAAALEAAVHAGDRLGGLIIESGFADTLALVRRLGGPMLADGNDREDGFGNLEKIAQIDLPTLIIHGEEDVIIPVADGRALHASGAAADRRLVTIPNAGHNDLLMIGAVPYFQAIADLVRAYT